MTSGQLLVFGASVLWILLCMRFWWMIGQDNVLQRRLIAIAAGVGGGLVYFIGTMVLDVLKPAPPQQPRGADEFRVSPGSPRERTEEAEPAQDN